MKLSKNNTCEHCGEPLAEQRSGGLCPACLMGEALAPIESLATEATEGREQESRTLLKEPVIELPFYWFNSGL